LFKTLSSLLTSARAEGPDPSWSYRGVCLMFLLIGGIAWLVPAEGEWIYVLRTIPLGLASVVGYLWLKTRPLADDAPDLLREMHAQYYEREGLCFMPVLHVSEGTCFVRVYFQNNYSNACDAKVCCLPMEGNSGSGTPEVPPIVANLRCEGGQVGCIEMPYPIAAKWQGKLMVYDVYAEVAYRSGRGDQLRQSTGLPAGEPTSELVEALITGVMIMFGTLRLTQGASLELRLPDEVAESAPSGAPALKVLWPPSGSTANS
jgi:hypothetical protein